VICIGGISGAGKTTLAESLLDLPNFREMTLFDLDWTMLNRWIRCEPLWRDSHHKNWDWFRQDKGLGMVAGWLKERKEGASSITYFNVYDFNGGQETYRPEINVPIGSGLLIVGWLAVNEKMMMVLREEGISPVNVIVQTDYNVCLERIKARALTRNNNPEALAVQFDKVDLPSWQEYLPRISGLIDILAKSESNQFILSKYVG